MAMVKRGRIDGDGEQRGRWIVRYFVQKRAEIALRVHHDFIMKRFLPLLPLEN